MNEGQFQELRRLLAENLAAQQKTNRLLAQLVAAPVEPEPEPAKPAPKRSRTRKANT